MTRRSELLTTLVVAAVSLAWGVPAKAASLGLPSDLGRRRPNPRLSIRLRQIRLPFESAPLRSSRRYRSKTAPGWKTKSASPSRRR